MENGLDIGALSAVLVKKVEELTLYIIDLNKQNEALQKKVEQLEKRIKK
jgi:chaperonin cofactor prefoldin